MIEDFLQDRSALYLSGAMTAGEREEFELILEFHDGVREFVAHLQGVASGILLSRLPLNIPGPSPETKSAILRAVAVQPRQTPEGLVATGPDQLVQWVNPAFTAMCGYSIDELRGKSLGPILQGKESDPAAVSRMRSAIHALRPCRETLVNYHKEGWPYWVDIEIIPVLDDERQPRWFVARERLTEPLAA